MSQEMLIVEALLVASLSLFALEKFSVELVAYGCARNTVTHGYVRSKRGICYSFKRSGTDCGCPYFYCDLLLWSRGIAGLSVFMTAL